MEDWNDIDSIDEELKKLEDEFSSDDGIMRELAAPSAADYWKKRLEEEKELWSKIIETKEEEKKALEAKLGKQEKDVSALKEQLKRVEESVAEEAQAWQQRLKTRETELLLERERVGWDEKFRGLQYENKILQEEFERAKKYYEEDRENIKNVHTRELEELLTAQNALVENLDSLERVIKELETQVEEKNNLSKELTIREEKMTDIVREYDCIRLEKNELQNKLDYLAGQLEQRRINYSEYSSCITDYFMGKVRDHLGTVLGIVNYCFHHVRIGRVIKKQLIVVSEVVDKILQTIENLTELVLSKRIDAQEISVERLFAKLNDGVDTSQIPVGLKLKVNYPELKKAMSPYFDRATKTNLRCRFVPVGNILVLEIVVQGEIKLNAEFVQLRHAVFLHEWSLMTAFENDKTTMSIEIPVVNQ